jgi:uncharacterized protein
VRAEVAVHVDLKELALRTGESWERTYPLEMSPVTLGGTRYEVLVPGGTLLEVERVAGGFLVHVTLSATIYGPCERCLREVPLQVEADEEEFVPTARDGWGESEFSEFIDDLVVDVGALARETLVLALPTQIVCSAECRGLCVACGQDLNAGNCACAADLTDARWERLRDLKLEL